MHLHLVKARVNAKFQTASRIIPTLDQYRAALSPIFSFFFFFAKLLVQLTIKCARVIPASTGPSKVSPSEIRERLEVEEKLDSKRS